MEPEYSSVARQLAADPEHAKVVKRLTHELDCKPEPLEKLGGRLEAQNPHPETQSEPEQQWPRALAPEALHGLAGEIVGAIEPHSEADPAALLVQVLIGFGSAIGRAPYFEVEAADHRCNLFAVIVGATSASRKGTSWAHVQRLLAAADQGWADGCVTGGLASGEGLIWAVRDAIKKQQPIRQDGKFSGYETVQVDEGVSDKRLLVFEPEFSRVLRVCARPTNTLSALIRQSWDTGNLRTLTKTNPVVATGAHVSIIAHITGDELRRELSETDMANGFANRFLFVCAKRSKLLPEGGRPDPMTLALLADKMRAALDQARKQAEIRRDEGAKAAWGAAYGVLSGGRPGLLGAITSRAAAQVVRLSLLFALLDCSATIRAEHVTAALAVWRYCEASARFIFGDALGDPTADVILGALRSSDGMSRDEIYNLFHRHKTRSEIGRALQALTAHGLACLERIETGGRRGERWCVLAR